MTRSAILKQNQGFLSTLPVGVIIAWHRDLDPSKAYIPPLSPGWVECNGQVLKDTESPFNGQIIPNLNGDPVGTNSPGLSRKAQMFLRGGAVSGEGQDDAFQGHRHSATYNNITGYIGSDIFTSTQAGNNGFNKINLTITDPTSDGINEMPRTAKETRPINMSVVWIMKVKQVVAAKATPAVQAATNAPLGAIYINQAGNVGIGTANPQAQLHVAGDLLGAARDVSGNALRICCGKTPEGATDWQLYGNSGSGIYLNVDTSLCGFKSTPIYIVNMHGNGNNWETTGGSSAYARTEKSFTIYVKFPDARALTPAFANSCSWHIQWIAIGT